MSFIEQEITDQTPATGPLPAGMHLMFVVHATVSTPEEAGDPGTVHIRLEFNSDEHPDFEGSSFRVSFSINHANGRDRSFARSRLATLLKAIGIAHIEDSDQLVGQALGVDLGVLGRRNQVLGYHSILDCSEELNATKALAMRKWRIADRVAPCPICEDVRDCRIGKTEVLCLRIDSGEDFCAGGHTEAGWLHPRDITASTKVSALVGKVSVLRRSGTRTGALIISARVNNTREAKLLEQAGLRAVGDFRGAHAIDDAVDRAIDQNVVVVADGVEASSTRLLIDRLLAVAKSVGLDATHVTSEKHATLADYVGTGEGADKRVRLLIEDAIRQVRAAKPVRMLMAGDFEAGSIACRWRVKGLMGKGEVGTLFGPWGVLKSFTAVALAVAIAEGNDFLGCKVEQGLVALVCGEGVAGMQGRLRAAFGAERMAASTEGINTRLVVIPEMPAITTRSGLDSLLCALRNLPEPPALLVIDTWARLLGACGCDENSSSDTGLVLAALDRLREEYPDVTILVIHHSGASNVERERGSTSLPAAADFRIQAQAVGGREATEVRLTITKQKDSRPPDPVVLTFEEVRVGLDAHGEPVTSLKLAQWKTETRDRASCRAAAGDANSDLTAIVEHLTNCGPKLGKDLLQFVTGRRSTAYNRLKKWVREGKLTLQGELYGLPAATP